MLSAKSAVIRAVAHTGLTPAADSGWPAETELCVTVGYRARSFHSRNSTENPWLWRVRAFQRHVRMDSRTISS